MGNGEVTMVIAKNLNEEKMQSQGRLHFESNFIPK